MLCRCVLRGCVPKKLLMLGSSVGELIEEAQGFGWEDVQAQPNWATLMQRKVTLCCSPRAGLYTADGASRAIQHISCALSHVSGSFTTCALPGHGSRYPGQCSSTSGRLSRGGC